MQIKSIKISILFLAFILFFTAQSEAQQIDPFYMNLFEKGKDAFVNSDYKDAAKLFKVALFGLQDNEELKGQANIFLGLSYYHLNDIKNCEISLKKAAALQRENSFRNMTLDELNGIILEKLLIQFRIGPYKDIDQIGSVPEVKDPDKIKADKVEIDRLEEETKTNPRNIPAFLTLAGIYENNKDYKNAKKTLQRMFKYANKNVYGHFCLGRIYYRMKDYKNAVKTSQKVFTLASEQQISGDILDHARVYQILSTYHNGEKRKATQLAAASRSFHIQDKITSLPLTITEKELLLTILVDSFR